MDSGELKALIKPVTRRLKGYVRFVGKLVTGKRKRFRSESLAESIKPSQILFQSDHLLQSNKQIKCAIWETADLLLAYFHLLRTSLAE